MESCNWPFFFFFHFYEEWLTGYTFILFNDRYWLEVSCLTAVWMTLTQYMENSQKELCPLNTIPFDLERVNIILTFPQYKITLSQLAFSQCALSHWSLTYNDGSSLSFAITGSQFLNRWDYNHSLWKVSLNNYLSVQCN